MTDLFLSIPSSRIKYYSKGLRGLLSKIDLSACEPDLKENLKAVYELLSHLEPEPEPSKSTPIKELDPPLLKN